MYVIIFLVKFRLLSGHLLGKKLLIRLTKCIHGNYFIVSFFPPRFLEWEFFLIAPFPDRCLLVPFKPYVRFFFLF